MITEDKALALVNEVRRARGLGPYFECDRTCAEDEALCRSIEQHEAFRQEVSDAMKEYCKGHGIPNYDRFIIHEPKPDPLVDVAKMMGYFNTTANHWAEDVRAALDALGFEIKEKGQ